MEMGTFMNIVLVTVIVMWAINRKNRSSEEKTKKESQTQTQISVFRRILRFCGTIVGGAFIVITAAIAYLIAKAAMS